MVSEKVLRIFSWKRIFAAVIIGLLCAAYLMWVNFDKAAFDVVAWTSDSFLWLLVTLLMIIIRHVAYMYRIMVLTDYQISWRHSFDVIVLWEFSSALTPSVVGGSGVALFIVHKEGLPFGRSTAVVMVTALLDELFYIIAVPITIIFVGFSSLFPVSLENEILGFRFGTIGLFVVGYIFILLLTLIILYAIFYKPRGFKSVLLYIFKWKWLKKWRYSAIEVGNDIITTSVELKGKSFSFWFKAFMATILSWMARFWIVNFMILMFLDVNNHLLLFGRQLVMWVILLISPTPGGSGVAELAFNGFLGEFTFGLAATFGLLWRLLTYYPYLFVGTVVLPGWLKRVYTKKEN